MDHLLYLDILLIFMGFGLGFVAFIAWLVFIYFILSNSDSHERYNVNVNQYKTTWKSTTRYDYTPKEKE